MDRETDAIKTPEEDQEFSPKSRLTEITEQLKTTTEGLRERTAAHTAALEALQAEEKRTLPEMTEAARETIARIRTNKGEIES